VVKIVVRNSMDNGDTIAVLPAFKLQLIQNNGIAFGMFDGHDGIILLVGGFIIFLLLLAAAAIRHNEQLVAPMAMLLAGSLGNLFDRLLMGSVTDFIRVPHWPAFNFADIFIAMGVALLLFRYIFPGSMQLQGSEGE
jgi:signal peptidase II